MKTRALPASKVVHFPGTPVAHSQQYCGIYVTPGKGMRVIFHGPALTG
jgi:hypothetical protein